MGNIVYNNQQGIHLEDETSTDDLTFWNNSIIKNTVYNNTSDGISISTGRNNYIIDNIAHHNGLGSINPIAGIMISWSNNNIVTGNTVHNNDNGIHLIKSANSRYTFNNTVTRNTVYHNDNAGIRLQDAKDNTFIDNSIFNNNYSVYMLSYLDFNLCNNNDFIDNSLSNATISNVYMENTTGNNFINCTLTNSGKEEFNLTDGSHAILLNTTFDKDRVYYGDTLSTLTVKWFMQTHVIYNSGNPVSSAEIWINDTFGTNILNGSADSQGWIKWIVVTEYIEQDIIGGHKGYKTYFTPHNGTATDGILWGYANPEPFMDESKTITIVLGGSTFVNLKPGWNLISLPRIQSDPYLKTILQSIEGDYDAVQWYDITDTSDPWKHNHISKPTDLNDLNELNHTIGIWIHVTNPKGTLLVVFGFVLSSNQNISLYPGWNLVGYPSLTSYNRTIGLNNIDFGPDVDSIWTYNSTKLKWIELSNEDYFERGRGYWIHSRVEKVWNVPL
jgi:parallel beta-helix repeat protein